jgi:type IV pilus assembly protein PilE
MKMNIYADPNGKGRMLMANEKGFSLIELLVTVAIIGLLAVVAIPTYRSHLIKTQRSDGKTALMESAQRLERFFTNNNTYTGATVGNANATIRATSEEGFFTISLPTQTATTYTIQADKNSLNDDGCNTLTINHRGVKTPPTCW